jgi:hypothetical protein
MPTFSSIPENRHLQARASAIGKPLVAFPTHQYDLHDLGYNSGTRARAFFRLGQKFGAQ